LSRRLADGLGFDEGGDPVVQPVDSVEAAVAALSLREALEIYRRLGMPAAEQVIARLTEIAAPSG
jgi:hypothetical protein